LFAFPSFIFVCFSSSCFCLLLFFIRFLVFLPQTHLGTINPTPPSAQIMSSSPHHRLTPSLPILTFWMSFAQIHHSNPIGGAYSML
jgi:hypothetical protein